MWGCSTSAILFSIYIWSIICFEKWWFEVISPSLRSITKNDRSMPFWLKTQDWSFLASLFSHRYSRVGFSSSTKSNPGFHLLVDVKGFIDRSCRFGRGQSTDPVVHGGWFRSGWVRSNHQIYFLFLIWILKINLVDFQYRSRSIIPFTTHVTGGTKVQSVRAAVQVECIDQMHVIGTRLTYVYIYI